MIVKQNKEYIAHERHEKKAIFQILS